MRCDLPWAYNLARWALVPGPQALLRERIEPAQERKAGEIAVSGAEGESMFDRQRREMGVRHEMGVHAGQRKELLQHVGMAREYVRSVMF